MFIQSIIKFVIIQPKLLGPVAFLSSKKQHRHTCPKAKSVKVCPGAGGPSKKVPIKRGAVCGLRKKDGGGGTTGGIVLKRALQPGKCRMAFIPDEWFLFFKPATGVTGPYLFMLGLGNYLISKEIFVMEHEYYLGLSEFVMVYYATTRFGPKLGAYLDKNVDEYANELEKSRVDELAGHEKNIKTAETAIWRAQGQKDLIAAKKENIAMQLEAIYRERLMMVHQGVRGRMEYHSRRHRVETRVHQKWMINWILENVQKSITPEFKKQAINSAISDLAAVASRQK